MGKWGFCRYEHSPLKKPENYKTASKSRTNSARSNRYPRLCKSHRVRKNLGRSEAINSTTSDSKANWPSIRAALHSSVTWSRIDTFAE